MTSLEINFLKYSNFNIYINLSTNFRILAGGIRWIELSFKESKNVPLVYPPDSGSESSKMIYLEMKLKT